MSALLKCPCCGCYMEQGHLTAGGYRIIWTPQPRKHSNILGPDDILLQRTQWLSSQLDNVAWHCRGCGRILVEKPQSSKDI